MASSMFEAFHRFGPRKVGEFHAGFAIPTHVKKLGASINILYRSDKTDPETLMPVKKPIDYIHDHDPGVHTYEPSSSSSGVAVPSWLCDADALVLLGGCLGFAYEDANGKERVAEGRKPLPELYTTSNGKSLLVIQSKKKIIALMWGGKLGVEPRGIVG